MRFSHLLLPQSFYERAPDVVARALLGKYLICRKLETANAASPPHLECSVGGRIVETEAYFGAADPASRAYSGKKGKLSAWMYSPPGTVFVYMVHGNWLFNIIAYAAYERAGAVLVRALEPCVGLEEMKARRRTAELRFLTSGPGKLTAALGITGAHTGLAVTDPQSPILVLKKLEESEPSAEEDFQIGASHRIGVRRDLRKKLRFFVLGNPYVSRKS